MTGLASSEAALRYAAECTRRGAERVGRDWSSLDIGAGLIGTISEDGEAAREVARVFATFYIPAMADEAAARHDIDPLELKPIREAFARGDIEAALRISPRHITEKLMMPVGTPAEWVAQLKVLEPLGYNHVCVTPIDNAMVRALVDLNLPPVPTVREQLQLIHDHVMPSLNPSSRQELS
jgi:5,10-methylenetetrahydromethanopterin reductase